MTHPPVFHVWEFLMKNMIPTKYIPLLGECMMVGAGHHEHIPALVWQIIHTHQTFPVGQFPNFIPAIVIHFKTDAVSVLLKYTYKHNISQ